MARDGSSSGRRLETPVEETREDFRPPEWLKKSRDDVPPNDRPLPKSPLVTLKPHNSSSGQTPDRPEQTEKAPEGNA